MEYMEHDFRSLMESMKAPFRTGQVTPGTPLGGTLMGGGRRQPARFGTFRGVRVSRGVAVR
eukprot:2334183-Rhodomonas_salina.1